MRLQTAQYTLLGNVKWSHVFAVLWAEQQKGHLLTFYFALGRIAAVTEVLYAL